MTEIGLNSISLEKVFPAKQFLCCFVELLMLWECMECSWLKNPVEEHFGVGNCFLSVGQTAQCTAVAWSEHAYGCAKLWLIIPCILNITDCTLPCFKSWS
ncbi:hypothetical protein O6H91_12G037100 [Diphasiastrum complanatum]|uniref:Uncharacterized protein n=1 Tax=Diphasiastrum complanatum TaxID=34168 RepID=A0ACC2C0I0_DIPCM|nr:hypothetical protein O6H91_12G037100 [Diphasiastrum complanatum]